MQDTENTLTIHLSESNAKVLDSIHNPKTLESLIPEQEGITGYTYSDVRVAKNLETGKSVLKLEFFPEFA